MQTDRTSTQSPRIDAHHHLWCYTPAEFGWIDDSMAELCRDFLVPDLEEALDSAHVDGTVAVQARQTLEESDWLVSAAKQSPAVLGVVGWLPLASPGLDQHLERLAAEPYFKGVRHVVQGEPDGFLDTPAFNTGIARLRAFDLVYDILIFAGQLPEAIRFVDRHPAQPFVLDHVAKPRIAANEIDSWREEIRDLARRPNVTCKLSGMVTEADPHDWIPDLLHPFAEVVLDAFGAGRLMIGTDWPVLTIGCEYARWWSVVEEWIAPLSATERAQILGGTAARVYGLESPTAREPEHAAKAMQGEAL